MTLTRGTPPCTPHMEVPPPPPGCTHFLQYESLPNKDEQFVLQRQIQDTEEHPISHRRPYQSREEVPYHPRGNFHNNPLREIAECPDSITTNQIKQHRHFFSHFLGEWKKCK